MQMRPRLIVTVAIFMTATICVCSSSCFYLRHRRNVEKSVLQENLAVMRNAIKQYTDDNKQSPTSLNELVEAGYLSTIPADPLTGSKTTWLLDRESPPLSAARTPGIINVRSGAEGNDQDGTPYRKY
jgi:general secretion pathway protein G